MSATDTGLTITPVYWAPSGFQFASGYTDVINKFVSDVAAASGANDNVFGVSTEYSAIKYKVAAGTALTDSTDYPSGGCAPKGAGVTACVSDAQVVTELKSLLTTANLPGGLDHIYPVFFPPGVQVQDGQGSYSVPGGDWCGEHGAVPWNNDQLVYAEDAYPPADGGCGGSQAPNGNAFADAAVSILSHELIEAITDPNGITFGKRAWNDSSGHEIGDECNQIYGLPLGSTDPANPQGSEYNQVIHGGKYYIQEEFSNASFASLGFAKGCVQTASGGGAAGANQVNDAKSSPLSVTGALQAAGSLRAETSAPATDSSSATDTPTATDSPTDSASSSSAAGGSSAPDGSLNAGGDGYALFLHATPDQLPADHTSTTEVDANVTDNNGDPVKDDTIHFSVNDLSGAGTCGKVNTPNVHTDANGDAHVTFTSGSGDATCDVVALEAKGGQSATTSIYQGAANSSAPTLRTTFPATLTPGSQSSFTTTYTNPSAKAMPNATLDVQIFGGADNSPTALAKQLHLTYSTNGEAGPFTAVALDGSTANGDYIAATIGPDAGQTLAPHSTTTLTFHVTAVSGIPTSDTLLQVESYLDQVDPASGSGNTLADTDPVTVAVGTGGSGSSSSTGLVIGISAGIGVLAVIAVIAFVILRRRRRVA